MTALLKMAAARELVDAGAVQRVDLLGFPGGWIIQLQTYNQAKQLATKQSEPRRFGSFESALRVLREMGVRTDALHVDAGQWDPKGILGAKRRPDRSAAMKLKDADARYTAMLREAVLEARADPRPALSSTDAKMRMDAVKAQHQATIDAAVKGKDVRA